MAFPTTVTNLEISGAGVHPYASRGLQQSLNWIGQASQLKRNVNGALKDLSLPQFKKFESVITGNDQLPPYQYEPGAEVTVKCLSELSYKTSGGSAQRSVVTGSSRTEGAYTFYRPELTMKVISLNVNTDEYGAVVSWNLTLQES